MAGDTAVGELSDRLAGAVAEAVSPDGQICASVTGAGDAVEVTMRRPGAYERYSDGGIAHQLSQLATLTAARHLRAEREIVADAFGESMLAGDGVDLDPELRAYRRAVTQLVAWADSDDAQIRLSTRGMVSWQVSLAPGTVRRLAEDEFLAQLHGAVGALFAQWRRKVMVVRDDLYDLGWSERSRRANGFGLRRDPRRVAR